MTIEFPSSFNLGDIERLIEDGISVQALEAAGEAARNTMQRRIRYQSLTVDGKKLDQNTPYTLNLKDEAGYPLDPLVATGGLTEPDAWEIDSGEGEVILTLASKHREKMDNIMNLAAGQAEAEEGQESRTRNWDKAFGLGDAEKTAFVKVVTDDISKQLGITVPSISDADAARYLREVGL